MLNSVYILVPNSIASEEVMRSQHVYGKLSVPELETCTLWHMHGTVARWNTSWFDETNVVLRGSSSYVRDERSLDTIAIHAARNAVTNTNQPPAVAGI